MIGFNASSKRSVSIHTTVLHRLDTQYSGFSYATAGCWILGVGQIMHGRIYGRPCCSQNAGYT